MMRTLNCSLIVLISICISAVPAFAQEIPDSLLKAAPLPTWVEESKINFSEQLPTDDVSGGEYFWSIELQWHIPSETSFYRSVVEVVSEAGLDGNGEWSFTFDPEYETQRIHWARVIRDGEVIYNYSAENLHLYNTESDIASRLLNGSLTALIILEDIRVGDIIDVASSIEGTNPALKDHPALRRTIGWRVPVGRQLTRILGSPDQKLRTKVILEDEPVQVGFDSETGLKEWRHLLTNSIPVRYESSTPSSTRVYGALQATSFQNWSEVADWAVPLYPTNTTLPDELKNEVKAIMSRVQSQKSRAIEALYYIQGNVRYLGLEMGHGAYKPREPELVWKRRFGDCKDKTLLLVRMLNEMGIDACPALVHTGWKSGIVDFLPSPIAFNHIIASIEIDGTRYWLDPTYSRQFGPLDKLPIEDYGYALLVRDGETTLTEVKKHPQYRNFVSAKTKFDVRRPGEESRMEVVIRYGGSAAANIRSYFKNNSLNDIGKNYSDYWASVYPHPKLDSPVEYKEFPVSGEVEIKEVYTIPDAWVASNDPEDPRVFFSFSPRTLQDYMIFPDRIERIFPYEIGNPISIRDNFEVHLFKPWISENTNVNIGGPEFNYRSRSTWGSVLNAEYTMTITGPVIPAEEVLKFESRMREVENDAGWELSWDPTFVEVMDESGDFDNLLAFLLFGTGAFFALLVSLPFMLKKRLSPPKMIPEGAEKYEGIGGWMILPIIGLTITPLALATQIFGEDMVWMFDKEQWATVSKANSMEFMILVGFESIYNGFMLVIPVMLLITLFMKRWFLPAMMVAYYITQVVFISIGEALYEMLKINEAATGGIPELVRVALVASLWATYFCVSKRVKATFRS